MNPVMQYLSSLLKLNKWVRIEGQIHCETPKEQYLNLLENCKVFLDNDQVFLYSNSDPKQIHKWFNELRKVEISFKEAMTPRSFIPNRDLHFLNPDYFDSKEDLNSEEDVIMSIIDSNKNKIVVPISESVIQVSQQILMSEYEKIDTEKDKYSPAVYAKHFALRINYSNGKVKNKADHRRSFIKEFNLSIPQEKLKKKIELEKAIFNLNLKDLAIKITKWKTIDELERWLKVCGDREIVNLLANAKRSISIN